MLLPSLIAIIWTVMCTFHILRWWLYIKLSSGLARRTLYINGYRISRSSRVTDVLQILRSTNKQHTLKCINELHLVGIKKIVSLGVPGVLGVYVTVAFYEIIINTSCLHTEIICIQHRHTARHCCCSVPINEATRNFKWTGM